MTIVIFIVTIGESNSGIAEQRVHQSLGAAQQHAAETRSSWPEDTWTICTPVFWKGLVSQECGGQKATAWITENRTRYVSIQECRLE